MRCRTILFQSILFALLLFSLMSALRASGLYRDGMGAASMSMGGAVVASPDGPLQSIGTNSAGLALAKKRDAELGVAAGIGNGKFTDKDGNSGGISGRVGVLGDFGMAYPLENSPLVLGVASYFQSALRASWNITDPPGGLDGSTSLGRFPQESEIILHRSALGVASSIGPKWSLGGSLGLVYNQNQLSSPYIFQSNPSLQGIKAALDLDTNGIGFDGNLGVLFRPTDSLQIGLSYSFPTKIKADGRATGDVRAQFDSLGGAFAAAAADFRYDATVINELPQVISGGITWNPDPRWKLSMQVDWYDWSSGFDNLDVQLRNGNNAAINSFVGSTTADDTIPLDWRNRFAYRLGVEHAIKESFRIRAGYVYSRSPVPDHSLMPLLALVSEHTIAMGFGFELGKTWVDVGYQAQLPESRSIETSRLRSGEFDNSKLTTGIHWVSATVRMTF